MSTDDRMNAKIGAYGPDTSDLPDGTDTFERLQEPDFTPVDGLSRFVRSRIIELELEPRGEVAVVYDEVGGPMAYRYARHMRADCVVFRRIAVQYLDAAGKYRESSGKTLVYATAAVNQAIAAMYLVANRWSDHPDFNEAWRIE